MNSPSPAGHSLDLSAFLPFDPSKLGDHQKALPAIAKDAKRVTAIEDAISRIPTFHTLYNADARRMEFLKPESVHLVVTSPPYWTLKEYQRTDGQLGFVNDYETFLKALDEVWHGCYNALVPGGRLVCVVGDVCLSRRKNAGVHAVIPLHAAIQEHCRVLGFTNLSPIIWHKIANAAYEADGNGGGFLGKPYEPNAAIKNDIEFILMQRKPGGYRSPSLAARILSVISTDKYQQWFQQIWTGLTGASTRDHPAPYPLALAERLVRMFSFVGDTVLDPFMGTGTTNVAAAKWGRNSIGVEITPDYFELSAMRVSRDTTNLFSETTIHLVRGGDEKLRRTDPGRREEGHPPLLEDKDRAAGRFRNHRFRWR
ncbi:MAG: methyltransferase [Betaproteobacteria bacterium RIFCSPLOWO2_02_FULL_65_20]|nr:MAG: methyltransferase [Betaproteobacteria bacterium RIFCSPLOWO2_02_FULL_65_20]